MRADRTIAPNGGKLILTTAKAVSATMNWKTILAEIFFVLYQNTMR